MKIVIIGGNSQSTPALFEYLSRYKDLPPLRIVLAGRNKETLAYVTRAAKTLSSKSPILVDYIEIKSSELEVSLRDADMVVLQIRVGGYAGRSFDESFPLRYNLCGDEGLGLGGLSAAWRTWPELLPLLRRVNYAASGALLIILSSPVSILVRAAIRVCDQMRVFGICELPWTILINICNTLGADASKVSFEYFGVNHLGWFYRITAGNKDLIDDYAKLRMGIDVFPPGELIKLYSGIPTSYLKLHFNSDEVLKQQKASSQTRGQILEKIGALSFSVFRSGSAEDIQSIILKRPAPWYPHALGPLILAVAGMYIPTRFFLSVLNEGYYSGLAEDEVLEIPHYVTDGKVTRCNRRHQVPEQIAKLTTSFVIVERLASLALLEGNAVRLEEAIRSHPWVNNSYAVQDMLRDIIGH